MKISLERYTNDQIHEKALNSILIIDYNQKREKSKNHYFEEKFITFS